MSDEDRPWFRAAPAPRGSILMHSGNTLFWETNAAGGRTYSSDEIGGGVEVWDTCLVGYDTLCEAMALEMALMASERRAAERAIQLERAAGAAISEKDHAQARRTLLDIDMHIVGWYWILPDGTWLVHANAVKPETRPGPGEWRPLFEGADWGASNDE